MIWQKNVKNDYLFLLHWQQMPKKRPPNSSLSYKVCRNSCISIMLKKSCTTSPTLDLQYIYICYNLKGGPKINQSTAHFQLELPSQTVSPQRVALQKVSPTLPEAWSHWMAFVQLQHPNCPPFSSSKKMQHASFKKKKRKMKPFEVHKEIPTPLLFATWLRPLFFETKRRWCTSPRWGSLSWPLWCRRWGRRYRCPFEIGQYLCRKAAWLAMVRICWCFLWGKSGCQSFNTWPISQMTWTLLEIQITSALSFFIKSRRPSSHVHPRAKTASMYFQTGSLLAFPNKQGLIPQKLQFQPRSTCVVHQEVFVDSHGCVTIDSHLPCSRAYPRVGGDRMKASHWHGWF